jgi:hypothetical protein
MIFCKYRNNCTSEGEYGCFYVLNMSHAVLSGGITVSTISFLVHLLMKWGMFCSSMSSVDIVMRNKNRSVSCMVITTMPKCIR